MIGLDREALRTLAAAAEPLDGFGASDEPLAAPALGWIVATLAPRAVLRVGLGEGACLAALARAAARLAPEPPCLALAGAAEEPGAGVERAARAGGGSARVLGDATEARAALGAGGAGLLSLGAGVDAATVLRTWRDALAPGAAVAIDAPDGAALDRAWEALRGAFGPDASAASLGGAVVAVPDGAGALGAVLGDASISAPLSALLERLGRGLVARAPIRDGRGDEDGALDAAGRAGDRALAAEREAEALRRVAAEASRRRADDDAALARAMAERERELHHARSRLRDMEKEERRLKAELEERFREIAALTRDAVAPEGAPGG